MEDCLDILTEIKNSPESDENLKSAANELYVAIKEQKDSSLDAFMDALAQAGGKVTNLAVTAGLLKIPVVGKYLAAAKLILGIGDFVFNVADMAEQFACTYAIAKSSSIVAEKFRADLASGETGNNAVVLYSPYEYATRDYFALAIIRKTSESQMKEADEANSFWLEWLYTEFLFSVDDINENVKKIDSIKFNYIMN